MRSTLRPAAQDGVNPSDATCAITLWGAQWNKSVWTVLHGLARAGRLRDEARRASLVNARVTRLVGGAAAGREPARLAGVEEEGAEDDSNIAVRGADRTLHD